MRSGGRAPDHRRTLPDAASPSSPAGMTQPRPQKSLVYALTLNAVLLGAILVVLLARGERNPFATIALAQDRGGGMPAAPAPIAGGAGLFLMPAQLAPNQWGCYVMDVDRQTLCAYQYVPSS